MRVLHVLETSLPELAGYSIRAKYIVENQKKHGFEPVVVTSPFFPSGQSIPAKETINGITYYRTNFIRNPSSQPIKVLSYLARYRMLLNYRKAVLDIAETERPDVIHSHSSYTNGYAGNFAAGRLGIPSVYEVRTLWGEAAVVEDGLRPESLKYRMIWNLELRVMRKATRVVAISDGIKAEIVRRGVNSDRIHIVPNGVDLDAFIPSEKNMELVAKHGLQGAFVLGYIGSIRKLEGLAYLIDAFRVIRERDCNVRLLIVGDGPDRETLERRARSLGLSGVSFVGKVFHERIPDYYSVCDALVFPRIQAKINRTVTPLKPLEAMSMGKVCLCSDVGGLTELVKDGYNGVVFKSEDSGDLSNKAIGLMADKEKYETLRINAMDWIRKERDWKILVSRYGDIYGAALADRSYGQ